MIGIISRLDVTPNNHDAYIVYKVFNDIASDYDESVIGILPNRLDKVKKIIDICDGIILQGGDSYTPLDLEITKYIYEKDIPCLGVCLGMQMMSMIFDGEMSNINNHNNTYHDVIIKDSNIYKDGVIRVNSRHKDIITKTKMKVVGISSDKVIEMVEKPNNKFFAGVQWHPENIYQNNCNSKILFNKFFNIVKNNKKML